MSHGVVLLLLVASACAGPSDPWPLPERSFRAIVPGPGVGRLARPGDHDFLAGGHLAKKSGEVGLRFVDADFRHGSR